MCLLLATFARILVAFGDRVAHMALPAIEPDGTMSAAVDEPLLHAIANVNRDEGRAPGRARSR